VTLQSPLRVLAVIRHPVGGIRTFLNYTYALLPASKYHFTIATVRTLESEHLVTHLDASRVEVVEVDRHQASLRLLHRTDAELKTGRYALLHSHGFTAGAIAATANLRWRVPHVLTSHDVFRPEQFPAAYGGLKRALLGRLLGTADAIHSVSHDAESNLLEYLPAVSRRAHLRVIVNGIDVRRFLEATAPGVPLTAELHLSRDTFLFGFLGRLVPQKGFECLIEAVSELAAEGTPPFAVVVISDGGYRREHQDRIQRMGLGNRFKFSGFRADVTAQLPRLDCVVMPSRWEACGLVAMEALVAGVPLIASSCPGLREVIAGTPATGIAPGNSRELAGAMRRAIQQRTALRHAAAAFTTAAAARFDVTHAAAALEELFDLTARRALLGFADHKEQTA